MSLHRLFSASAIVLTLSGLALAAPSMDPTPITRDYARSLDEYPMERDSIAYPNYYNQTGASPAKSPAEARALGADWLAKVQNNDGGWGAGALGYASAEQASDAATTAITVLALARDAGATNKHASAIEKGTRYLVNAVKTSDPNSPRLNTPSNTQPQYKLGQLVDTHLTALVLAEVSGRFDKDLNDKVSWALDYCIGKVQMAQQADGSFDSQGWAPVLSSSIAAMSLYKAAEAGVDVRRDVLDRSEAYQAANVAQGSVNTGAGAGVELYVAAGSFRNSQEAAKRGGRNADEAEAASEAMRTKVNGNAQALMTGFGSVGGEEMLSYMMISEAMAAEGGKQWTEWQTGVGQHLQSIQNADGSWVGAHCITSPVFVTAGAVLTLSTEPPKGKSGQKGGDSKAEATRSTSGSTLVEVSP